jgi:hypothetical protein
MQSAFPGGNRLRITVICALAGLLPDRLRPCLESSSAMKAIHNVYPLSSNAEADICRMIA